MKPGHREALDALAAAIAALPSPTPCHGDTAWISDGATGDEQAEARHRCTVCPVFAPCDAAGRFEIAGIWAGTTRP